MESATRQLFRCEECFTTFWEASSVAFLCPPCEAKEEEARQMKLQKRRRLSERLPDTTTVPCKRAAGQLSSENEVHMKENAKPNNKCNEQGEKKNVRFQDPKSPMVGHAASSFNNSSLSSSSCAVVDSSINLQTSAQVSLSNSEDMTASLPQHEEIVAVSPLPSTILPSKSLDSSSKMNESMNQTECNIECIVDDEVYVVATSHTISHITSQVIDSDDDVQDAAVITTYNTYIELSDTHSVHSIIEEEVVDNMGIGVDNIDDIWKFSSDEDKNEEEGREEDEEEGDKDKDRDIEGDKEEVEDVRNMVVDNTTHDYSSAYQLNSSSYFEEDQMDELALNGVAYYEDLHYDYDDDDDDEYPDAEPSNRVTEYENNNDNNNDNQSDSQSENSGDDDSDDDDDIVDGEPSDKCIFTQIDPTNKKEYDEGNENDNYKNNDKEKGKEKDNVCLFCDEPLDSLPPSQQRSHLRLCLNQLEAKALGHDRGGGKSSQRYSVSQKSTQRRLRDDEVEKGVMGRENAKEDEENGVNGDIKHQKQEEEEEGEGEVDEDEDEDKEEEEEEEVEMGLLHAKFYCVVCDTDLSRKVRA